MLPVDMPREYDFGAGSLVELSYLETVFGISRRTAALYLKALRIKPVYIGKQVLFSLSTLKRLLFVLNRPGGPGFIFPGSKMKNSPRVGKNPEYLTKVTDEILEQAADPAILAEMAGASGRDSGILKQFVPKNPVGRPPQRKEKMSKYVGITYPSFLYNRVVHWLWKRYMCPRNRHLFDEVWAVDEHYLYCDACELEVHIKSINPPEEK